MANRTNSILDRKTGSARAKVFTCLGEDMEKASIGGLPDPTTMILKLKGEPATNIINFSKIPNAAEQKGWLDPLKQSPK